MSPSKEAEADDSGFEALFDGAPAPLVLHNGETIVLANQAIHELLGYEPGTLVGRPVISFLRPETLQSLADRFDGEGAATIECPVLKKDGSTIQIVSQGKSMEWQGQQMRLANIQPVSIDDEVLASMREEAAIAEELHRLKETNQFKTQILNTTAHELNTPLTPVRLQLHLLKTGALGNLTERHRRSMDIIDRNIERLAFLVNDILDVARLESGRLDIHREPALLSEIMKEALESYEETASRVGVSVKLNDPNGLVINADAARITQVIYNLIGNALKFTPEGGSVVVNATSGDGVAIISVEDTGPGMTDEQIGRLFEPFSRVHDTAKSTIAGTGLGLYICRGIMEAHDGTITATSKGPDQGSQFTIQIPLSTEEMPVRKHAAETTFKPLDPLAQRLRELI